MTARSSARDCVGELLAAEIGDGAAEDVVGAAPGEFWKPD